MGLVCFVEEVETEMEMEIEMGKYGDSGFGGGGS